MNKHHPPTQWFTDFQSLNTPKAVSLKESIGQKYGYYCYLLTKGVGFKFWKNANRIHMDLGFTHYLSFEVPQLIKVTVKKTRLLLFSTDRQQLFNYVYFLRNTKYPDPYKGKGVRFFNEPLRLKVGKVKN